jgi:hypothetical protein
LVTPFDVMAEVAQHHYWYFLAKWLVLDKYDNVSKLRNYQGHTAVLLAGQDEMRSYQTGAPWPCSTRYRVKKRFGALNAQAITAFPWNQRIRGGGKPWHLSTTEQVGYFRLLYAKD